MDIPVRQLKRLLRTGLTYFKTWVKGYPLRYGRRQDLSQSQQYELQWSEFVTAIPQRPGADEVNANRLWNLNQAAQRIDGLILQPGEIFGFWNRVPKPTLRNGFREGPAFKRGKVTTDVGGGLCLISTNVFNALLLAGCEILERHHHSMDPYGDRRFFPLGRDAMVYHGYRDLILRNPSDIPIQLRLEVIPEAGIVRCAVMGQAPCPVQVRLEAEVLETFAVQEPGQIAGYRVVARRWISPDSASGTADSELNDYSAVSAYKSCDAYFAVSDRAIAAPGEPMPSVKVAG